MTTRRSTPSAARASVRSSISGRCGGVEGGGRAGGGFGGWGGGGGRWGGGWGGGGGGGGGGKDAKRLRVRTVALEENYRSDPAILRAAGAAIAGSSSRFAPDKMLRAS